MDIRIIRKIDEILKIFKENDDYELEFKYEDKISKEKFNKIINFYKKQKLKIHETTYLNIIFLYNKKSYRITIDNTHIDKYSSTNIISKDMIKEILNKELIKDYKPILIKSNNFKLNFKKEISIDDNDLIDLLLKNLSTSLKGFRFIKRTSFISKNYNIDLSIVNNYNNSNPKLFISNKFFSKNNILNDDNYEIEIEAHKNHDLSSQDFLNLTNDIYDIISNDDDKLSPVIIKEEKPKTNLKWMLPNRIGYAEKIFKNFHPDYYNQPSLNKKSCDCNDDVACDISNKTISLFPQQKLIKDYIQFDSPYRGALLFHELGSGKSGASIAAAEGYINKKKMFVISPASLAVNYENEILKLSSIGLNLKKDWKLVKVNKTNPKVLEILLNKYAIDKSIIKKDGLVWIPLYDNDIPNATIIKTTIDDYNKTDINLMTSHIIRNRYTFISYNGLTKKLITSLGKSPFDNSFIIIDEVHNFASRIVNGSVLARDLYSKMMNAVDCRIILLSGTPIINNPYEIATILNLIRGYINVYELNFLKNSIHLNEDDFISQLKKDNLLSIIDDYFIDNENKKLLISLLPHGFKKENNSTTIFKNNWGFTTNKAIENIIESINQIKNFKVSVKTNIIPFSALPNNRDDFNSTFIDNTDDENPKVKNNDLFIRRILGTLSYYAISGSELFPKRLPDITRYLDMSDNQFKKYQDVRAIERKMDNAKKGKPGGLFDDKSSVYRAFSRMVCNFTFPEGIDRVYPNDVKKLVKKEMDDDENARKYDEIKDNVPIVADLYEQQLKMAMKKLLDGNYLNYDNVKKNLSPKFAQMFDDMNNTPGSVLVYSQFRSVEGLGLFSEFLNNNGYIQVDIKKIDGEYHFTNSDAFNPIYDNKRYVIFDQDKEKTNYLRNLFNGDLKNIPNELLENLGRNPNQLHGKLIKAFFITASGAEGISLKNVRAVLITEPYWNNVRIEQVIGRAIRSCSHESLPLIDRNVVVYRYLMRFTKKQIEKDYSIATLDKGISTDEHIALMAEKKMAIVSQFLSMLKSSSFDCVINAKQNKPLINNFKCYSWALGVNKDDLSYTSNIKDDYKIMKHRNFQIPKKNKGKVISKNGQKFVLLNGKIYNYYSYINAGVLIPEEI